MLPPGLSAQPADRATHHRFLTLHPAAKTVARLLVGACSCDLVRPRQEDPREDERHHRERHRRAGTRRDHVLAALERHRRGVRTPPPAGGWPRALAAFVAEHARNAGPTLYLLRFESDTAASPPPDSPPLRRTRAAEVVGSPDSWLVEGTVVLVE